MKLKKAIEILEELLSHVDYPLIQDDSDAIKLGIEALKYIERSRAFGEFSICHSLKGETFPH